MKKIIKVLIKQTATLLDILSLRITPTKSSPSFLKPVLSSLLVVITLQVDTVFADAQLMVSPTRIMFEDNARSEQITLINSGTAEGRYRISMVRRQLTENGEFINIDEKTPGNYADEMVRFSPRQVTLQPGKSQTIRIQLRKPRDLAKAEYRSHMLFQKIPDPSKSNIETMSGTQTEGLTINIIPIVGISIPVIVRHGELESTVSLTDFQFSLGNTQNAKPKLSMTINREGSSSIYGDFIVEFTPKGKQAITVAQTNGIAVYTPIPKRLYSINLNTPDNLSLSNGQLTVKFMEHGKSNEESIITQARMLLP